MLPVLMLKLVPLTLHEMGSVQGRLHSLPLGLILLASRKNKGQPLEIFGIPQRLTSDLVSFHTNPYLGCYTFEVLTWIIADKEWFSRPLATFWWCKILGSGFLGSIPWSCVKHLCFGGVIPSRSILSVVHRSEKPLWTRSPTTFFYLPCNHRSWSRECRCLWDSLDWRSS